MLCICHNCQCFNVLHTHNLTLRLTSNAEEQRQCLGCCNEENTCADDHHDLLFHVLFLVVHGDVNAYGSDNCNDTCNGIAGFTTIGTYLAISSVTVVSAVVPAE